MLNKHVYIHTIFKICYTIQKQFFPTHINKCIYPYTYTNTLYTTLKDHNSITSVVYKVFTLLVLKCSNPSPVASSITCICEYNTLPLL